MPVVDTQWADTCHEVVKTLFLHLTDSVFFPRLLSVGNLVDPSDLIGATEVQHILRLSHPSSVTTYLKRYDDFPRPVVDLSESRIRLWLRQDIEAWKLKREGTS